MKLYYFLLMLLIVATGITLSLTVFFHIQTIDVEGICIYENEKIIEVAGIEIGQNLFLCDTDKAEKQLETQLPYIENAEVTRRLPTGINIFVEEAVLAGQVCLDSGYALISETGKVLEILPERRDGLLVIYGLEVAQAVEGGKLDLIREQDKQSLFDLQKALLHNGIEKINHIEFVGSSEVFVLYDSRIRIKIGTPTALNYKLEFAKRILEEKIGAHEKGTLDLSLLSSNSEKASFIPDTE